MPISISGKRVLVTGANGFIGSHCVKSLLSENCLVRGTVRSLKDKKNYETLYTLNPSKNSNLEIVEGDLKDPSVWDNIVKDCDFVLHIASPVFKEAKDKPNLQKSAVLGTKHVLEACLKHNIKKVVVTSSISAILYRKEKKTSFYDSSDFSDPDSNSFYASIKVAAERLAWQISIKSKGKMNLSVICPGLVIGQYLMPKYTSSSGVLIRVFNSKVILPISLSTVSIQDVVLAHINCLKRPIISKGKRYILVENSYWMKDVRDLIGSEFEQFGYNFRSIFLSVFFVWILSFFFGKFKRIYKVANVKSGFDCENVKEDLGVYFRGHRGYFLEGVYSLIEKGFIEDKVKGGKRKVD